MRLRCDALVKTVMLALALPLFLYGRCPADEMPYDRGAEVAKDRGSEIVSSLLKAYGGAEVVKKVVSVVAKGNITQLLSGKSGHYARYFQRPGRLRIEVMPEEGGEVRVLNGERGWQATEKGFVAVPELELQSMLYQYSYLNLPMGLASGNYHARYGGGQPYKGRETLLLFVQPKHGPRLGILVDAKSGLIIRVDASFPMGGSGIGELSTEYGDYRPVDGVQFPHKLTSYAGGIMISEILLDDIQVNRKIPPELFTPQEIELRKLPSSP
ncbi:hypothetical protein [Geomonas sp.]|uniref:hypothetical protein n=1 Tax=Geomonas sp. TaxID=2651584 RepID=UPI002B4775FE|nr:hypothetical protein [Geomonas sp.]HJV35218.1 hypothetical protein [Geomonas sp.]